MTIINADKVRTPAAGRQLPRRARTRGERAMMHNGRGRRLEKPDKMKLKHLELKGSEVGREAGKLRTGVELSSSELRRELYKRLAVNEEKGGMHCGEGRHD